MPGIGNVVGWQVLVVPHRRLISFCCVTELHEPGRFQPFSNRQRGLFLFNDLLLASTSLLMLLQLLLLCYHTA